MPPNIEDLDNRLRAIEIELRFLKSDRFSMSKDLEMQDGRNMQVAKGTGTKIGTASTEKLGFWGVTPKVQQNYISHPAADVGSLQTAVDTLLTELENIGIINPTS